MSKMIKQFENLEKSEIFSKNPKNPKKKSELI